jgi:hypothetical protein
VGVLDLVEAHDEGVLALQQRIGLHVRIGLHLGAQALVVQ